MADRTVAFRPFPGRSFSITGDASDAGVVGELERSGGLYQRDLAALLERRLGPDSVAVDIGAHIGVVTVLLAALSPRGRVYAFEPVAENYAHLCRNVAANDLENVTAQHVAVFDTDGQICVEYDPSYPGGSHVAGDGLEVPSVRFDSWAAGEGLTRLDLVKLDVEGAELAVLDGAAEALRRFRPLAVVECNPVALSRFAGAGYRTLLGRMRALFPVVAMVAQGGAVIPILSDRHLQLSLTHRGVVDLVGFPDRPARGEQAVWWARAATDLARLHKAHNPWRPPPENFVVDPGSIGLRSDAALQGHAGEVRSLPVEVRNGTKTWLSSQFRYHPVHLSYRWFDAGGNVAVAEGHRSAFPEPLAPGKSQRLDATVQLPPAPGEYTLCLTLVQEHFAWLDEIDTGFTARLAVHVDPGPT